MSQVQEAVAAGARQEAAAEILGLKARILQRWWQPSAQGGEDRRHGPLRELANKVSPTEQEVVLDTANSPLYLDLPPKQIVPPPVSG